MAKIVYRQMPAPRELSQQIPPPRAKARMQKPQGGGKFLVQIPGGARGMVMDETDTCINKRKNQWGHETHISPILHCGLHALEVTNLNVVGG